MPRGYRLDGSKLGFQKGYKVSEENKIKSSERWKGKDNPIYKIDQRGELNFAWKGEGVSKRGVHKWIELQKGKPMKCEICGTIKADRYDWANIDHKYTRILEHYIRMCRKCHLRYDTKKFGYTNLRTK